MLEGLVLLAGGNSLLFPQERALLWPQIVSMLASFPVSIRCNDDLSAFGSSMACLRVSGSFWLLGLEASRH